MKKKTLKGKKSTHKDDEPFLLLVAYVLLYNGTYYVDISRDFFLCTNGREIEDKETKKKKSSGKWNGWPRRRCCTTMT